MRNVLERIIFCVWLVLALAACNPQPAQSEKAVGRKAQAIIAESVVWQPQTSRIEAVGTSRAQQSIVLFPEVAGLVEAVLFKPRERVETGQTLLQLESEDEQLAVNAARLELEDAKRLLSRYRQTKSASAATLEEAQSTAAPTRINLAWAEVALEEHSTRAPFAGWLGITDVDVGARIDPSTPVTSLDDRELLWVTSSLPETYYQQLQTGMPVTASSWTHGSEALPARLVHVDSRIDPKLVPSLHGSS